MFHLLKSYHNRVLITWNTYNRILSQYRRNKKKNLEYFLRWNAGTIPWRYVEEEKIFNAQDYYYIRKTRWNWNIFSEKN